jgi:hypothetical protein
MIDAFFFAHMRDKLPFISLARRPPPAQDQNPQLSRGIFVYVRFCPDAWSASIVHRLPRPRTTIHGENDAQVIEPFFWSVP